MCGLTQARKGLGALRKQGFALGRVLAESISINLAFRQE